LQGKFQGLFRLKHPRATATNNLPLLLQHLSVTLNVWNAAVNLFQDYCMLESNKWLADKQVSVFNMLPSIAHVFMQWFSFIRKVASYIGRNAQTKFWSFKV